MNSRVIGESVVAVWKNQGAVIKSKLSYDEARDFCDKNGWQMECDGRICELKIMQDDDERISRLSPLLSYSRYTVIDGDLTDSH